LRKTCPDVYKKVSISKYAFKKVAIDTSIFMCKFKNASGLSFMDSFLHLVSVLRYNEVHFVFVYDSKAPPEKDRERQLRVQAREKNKIRVERLDALWSSYKETGDGSDVDDCRLAGADAVLADFIRKIMDTEDCRSLVPQKIDAELLKMKNSLLSIRSEDFALTKEFFRACRIPCIDAEGEAEATCTELVRRGLAAAVLTEDTDVLAYGANVMLHRMDTAESTVMEIDYEELLGSLGMTTDRFLDFCIMCGTDYNSNIPKIGPEKAFRLLQEHKSIDGIATVMDVGILNHHVVRSLFRRPVHLQVESIPYCGFPDIAALEKLCFVHNCRFDLERMYECFHNSVFHCFEFPLASSPPLPMYSTAPKRKRQDMPRLLSFSRTA
jgi:5'-3' exonuclease